MSRKTFKEKWNSYSRNTKRFMIGCWAVTALMLAYLVLSPTPNKKVVSTPTLPTAEQVLIERKWEAVEKCRDVVQFSSQFPTKASFSGSTIGRDVDELPGGGFTVRGRVSLMNALGAMIPHSFTCTIGADGKPKPPFSITPG